MNDSMGVHYVAINAGIADQLAISIESLHKHSPDISICVSTDRPNEVRRKSYKYIDSIIQIPSILPIDGFENRPPYPDQGYFSKVFWMYQSPYDLTLFLDHDTYITGDVCEIMDTLVYGGFHVAVAHDVGRPENCPYGSLIPWAYRMFNTGVVAFRRCKEVDALMKLWLKYMLELNNAWGDQPTFMRAMYESHDIRYATLPCEYNLRFIFPQVVYNPVVILHGRSGNYEKISQNVNRIHDCGRFWFVDKSYGRYDLTTGTIIGDENEDNV